GICGVIAARDALGLATRVVGVVSEGARCAQLSVAAGRLVETPQARTFADGMAVRVPVQEAFEIYARGADRIIAVSDHAVAEAIRIFFTCCAVSIVRPAMPWPRRSASSTPTPITSPRGRVPRPSRR
ncbi:MAG: pyridoxal-phosphate dependent enzyme, partial [Gemmobacter sp.]